MERRLRVIADTTTCAGTRQCVLQLPEVFGSGPDHLVVVLDQEVLDATYIRDAIDMCPTQSISAIDVGTGEHVYP